MKISGIYVLTHIATGRKYVGQSVDVESRYRQHKKAHANTKIAHAIKKYGVSAFSFDVVDRCSREDLNQREKFWIEHFKCLSPDGFNLKTGGDAVALSDETKAKIAAANRKRIVSDETRKKMSDYAKSRSPETRKKISVGRSGIKHSEEAKAKIAAASKRNAIFVIPALAEINRGTKRSIETRAKIAASNRKRSISDETRKKMSESQKRRFARIENTQGASNADTQNTVAQ